MRLHLHDTSCNAMSKNRLLAQASKVPAASTVNMLLLGNTGLLTSPGRMSCCKYLLDRVPAPNPKVARGLAPVQALLCLNCFICMHADIVTSHALALQSCEAGQAGLVRPARLTQ